MKRLIGIILFFSYLATSLLSAETKQRVVAFAQDDMSNDFRKAQVSSVEKALQQYPDTKFIYKNAKGQTSLLIHQIEQFITMGVDAIVVGTNDESAVVPVIAKAYDQNITMIILDRGIKGDRFTTFIHSDNVNIGQIGGEYIAKRLGGKGTVLLFEGLQKADVTQLRSQGFLSVMQKYPDIKVIKRTGNYLRKDAIKEMEKVVAEGIKVDAIFSESDSMLSGVRSVLKRYSIDPASIIMIGCDYTSEAKKAIIDGTQTGSILFPLGGKESAMIAVDTFNGKEVPKDYVIPVELITSENVQNAEPIF